MTAEQAFDILGIYDRNIDESALKRAFYEAARYTHPDSNPDDEHAKAKFNMINEAYDVLLEYLKSEKRSQSATKATDTKVKDAWDTYSEADRKFAKERHRQAQARAEEAIKKKAEEERKEREEREAANRQTEANAQKEAERRSYEWQDDVQQIKDWASSFWKQKIKNNEWLKKFAIVAVAAVLLLWTSTTVFRAFHSVANFVRIMGELAKWILIVWFSCAVTKFVQENWKNRILSIFAFLTSMEIAIWSMSWLVNHIILSYN